MALLDSLIKPITGPLVQPEAYDDDPGYGQPYGLDPTPPKPARADSNFRLGGVRYADGPRSSYLTPSIGSPDDIMQLDMDPFGTKTDEWHRRLGKDIGTDRVETLNVFGKVMPREQLEQTEAGRRLLEISDLNRRGVKRGFMEALTDGSVLELLPFVSMFAAVGKSFVDAKVASDALTKLQNGEPVTDDELIKARLFMAEQQRQSEGTWGATLADIVKQAPGFMVEFAATGGIMAGARTLAAKAAASGSKNLFGHLAMTRAAKVTGKHLADAMVRAEGKALTGDAMTKATDTIARHIVSTWKQAPKVVGKVFGGEVDEGLMMATARARAETELKNAALRAANDTWAKKTKASIGEWLTNSISRGILDQGMYGAPTASVLTKTMGSFGKQLADAIGTLGVEATVKGGLQFGLSRGLSAAGAVATGTELVSRSQMGLQASALVNDDRYLMDNAVNFGRWMDLLEYTSENSGAGFTKLFGAVGTLLRPKMMSGASGAVGRTVSNSAAQAGIVADQEYQTIGGKILDWINKTLGTRETYAQGVRGEQVRFMRKALEKTAGVDLTGVTDDALRAAVEANSTAGLASESARKAIGPDVRKFARDAISAAYDENVEKMKFRHFWQFRMADYMVRHHMGPASIVNAYAQMGYDGILEEMLEERYTDIAQGLFGLNDDKDRSFGNRLVNAAKGIWPGFHQLSAEAVGFSIPMVTRLGAMRLQKRIMQAGKSQFDEARDYCALFEMMTPGASIISVPHNVYQQVRDARKNQEIERKTKIAQEIIQNQAVADDEARPAHERDAAKLRIDELNRESEGIDKTLGAIDEADRRFYTANPAETLAEKTMVDIDASFMARGFQGSKAGEGLHVGLSSNQNNLQAERWHAFVSGAPNLAKMMFNMDTPLEDEAPSGGVSILRRLAARAVGIAGFVSTGEFSLVADNPIQYIAEDHNILRSFTNNLKNTYAKYWNKARRDIVADRIGLGTRLNELTKSVEMLSTKMHREAGIPEGTSFSTDPSKKPEGVSDATFAEYIKARDALLAATAARSDDTAALRDAVGKAIEKMRAEYDKATDDSRLYADYEDGMAPDGVAPETYAQWKKAMSDLEETRRRVDETPIGSLAISREEVDAVADRESADHLRNLAVAQLIGQRMRVFSQTEMRDRAVSDYVKSHDDLNLKEKRPGVFVAEDGTEVTTESLYRQFELAASADNGPVSPEAQARIDEINAAVEKIARATLDIIVNRSSKRFFESGGRNGEFLSTVIRVPAGLPDSDRIYYNAALSMVGFNHDIVTVEADANTPLQQILADDVVPTELVAAAHRYAFSDGTGIKNYDAVPDALVRRLAECLHFPFTATSPAEEYAWKRQIVDLAVLAEGLRDENEFLYMREEPITGDETEDRLRPNGRSCVKARRVKNADGRIVYRVPVTRENGKIKYEERDTIEELDAFMRDYDGTGRAFTRGDGAYVFTAVQVVESDDPITMLINLNLLREYSSATTHSGEKNSTYVHPYLRKGDDGNYLCQGVKADDGTVLMTALEQANIIARRELAAAMSAKNKAKLTVELSADRRLTPETTFEDALAGADEDEAADLSNLMYATAEARDAGISLSGKAVVDYTLKALERGETAVDSVRLKILSDLAAARGVGPVVSADGKLNAIAVQQLQIRLAAAIQDVAKRTKIGEAAADLINGIRHSKAVDAAAASANDMYERVLGEEGYLTVADEMLRSHGVTVTGTRSADVMSLATVAGARTQATYQFRPHAAVNFSDGNIYVSVDYSRGVDRKTSLLQADLLRKYATNRDLLSDKGYGEQIHSFLLDLDGLLYQMWKTAKTDAEKANYAMLRSTFTRGVSAVPSKVLDGHGDFMTPNGRTPGGRHRMSPQTFIALTTMFVFGADNASHTMLGSALAKVAPYARLLPSYPAFYGIVDLMYGGNPLSLDDHRPDEAPSGVAAVMRLLGGRAGAYAGVSRGLSESALIGGIPVSDLMDKVAARYFEMFNETIPAGKVEQIKERVAKTNPEYRLNMLYASIYDAVRLHVSARELPGFLGELIRIANVAAYNVDPASPESTKANASSVSGMVQTIQAALANVAAAREKGVSAATEYAKAASAAVDAKAEFDIAQRKVADLTRDLMSAIASGDAAATANIKIELEAARSDRDEKKAAWYSTSKRRAEARADVAMSAVPPSRPAPDAATNAATDAGDTAETVIDPSTGEKPAEPVEPPAAEEPPDIMSNEEDDEYTVLFGEDQGVDLPSVLTPGMVTLNEQSKSEPKPADGLDLFTDAQKIVILRSVLHAFTAEQLTEVTEDAVAAMMTRMMPWLQDENLRVVLDAFSFYDRRRIAEGVTWDKLLTRGAWYTDDDADDDGAGTSSDNFNNDAVDQYTNHALADYLAIQGNVAPETGRNFQAFCSGMREQIDYLRAVYPDSEAAELLHAVFNPRTLVPGGSMSENLAEYNYYLERFDNADLIRRLAMELLSGGVGKEPMSRQGAFFMLYLTTMSSGARADFLSLVSSSAVCMGAMVDDSVDVGMEPAGASKPPPSETTVRSTFAFLQGMSAEELRAAADKLMEIWTGAGSFTDAHGAVTTLPADFALPVYVQPATLAVKLSSVATMIDSVFGGKFADTPFYRILTSRGFMRHLSASLVRSMHDSKRDGRSPLLKQVLSRFERGKSYGAIPELAEFLYSLSRLGRKSLTMDDITAAASILMSVGSLGELHSDEPTATPSRSSVWGTLLTLHMESTPETIVRARMDPFRSDRMSSIAQAARGVIPLIQRFFDDKSENGFDAICRRMFPNVTDDELSTCRQELCWPDFAHTPILAKNQSKSLNPKEVHDECAKSMFRLVEDILAGRQSLIDPVSKTSTIDETKVFYFPLYSGDHASSAMIQVPAAAAVTAGVVDVFPRDRVGLASAPWKFFSDERIVSFREEFKPVAAALRKALKDGTAPVLPAEMFTVTGKGTVRAVEHMRKEVANAFFDAAYSKIVRLVGLHLLGADTKRSAVSCLEAVARPMRGVVRDANGIPVSTDRGHTYGTSRVLVTFNTESRDRARDDGTNGLGNETMTGNTILYGYGAEVQRHASKDQSTGTLKLHAIGVNGFLSFIKSLVLSPTKENGGFLANTALRTYTDFLESELGAAAAHSSILLTDLESYKIGPLNNKNIVVRTKDGDMSVLEYLFRKVSERIDGKTEDEVKGLLTSDFVEGLLSEDGYSVVNKVTGEASVLSLTGAPRGDAKMAPFLQNVKFHVIPGKNGLKGVTIGLSYEDNDMLTYSVANVSHESTADDGKTPRNHVADALAMARVQMDSGLDGGTLAAKRIVDLIADWGLANAVVSSDRRTLESYYGDESVQRLLNVGESPTGMYVREAIAMLAYANLKKNIVPPMYAVNAPLVTSMFGLSATGDMFSMSNSAMVNGMTRASEVLSSDEADFYSWNGAIVAKRRSAMFAVNISQPWFRHGLFLDEDMFRKDFARLLHDDAPDRDSDLALGIAYAFDEVKAAQDLFAATRSEADRKRVRDLRRKLFACFLDHHGKYVADRVVNEKTGETYSDVVMIDDLFADMTDGSGNTMFDLTALYFSGADRVHADFDGEDAPARVVLGGTMFGFPRTPSYNGNMWLQTARAGLPCTEVETEVSLRVTDGLTIKRKMYLPGKDAMVSPDPVTNAILGCDHDGDKAKLYVYRPNNATHSVKFDMPPSALENDDGTRSPVMFDRADFVANPNGTRAYLMGKLIGRKFVTQARRNGEPTGGMEISKAYRAAVGNMFVRCLFNMSRALPTVKPGGSRTVFRGAAVDDSGVGSYTKFRPTDPGMFKAYLESADFMAASDILKGHVIADAEVGAEVSARAADASAARGRIVSLAMTLHLAYFLGGYNGGKKNLLKGMDMDGWLRFMYRVDGLSNATFDDLKAQICSRLGWTSSMMDTVVAELLASGAKAPTTDAEFLSSLTAYAHDVARHGAHYWMARASDITDEDFRMELQSLFNAGKYITSTGMADFFGLVERVDPASGESTYVPRQELGSAQTGRMTIGQFMTWLAKTAPGGYDTVVTDTVTYTRKNPDGSTVKETKEYTRTREGLSASDVADLYRMFVRESTTSKNYNPMLGRLWHVAREIMVAVGAVTGSADDVSGNVAALAKKMGGTFTFDIASIPPAKVRELRGLIADIHQWSATRGLLTDARGIANAVNFTTADPGDVRKSGRRNRVADAFRAYEEWLGTPDGAKLSSEAGKGGLDAFSVAERMHAATLLSLNIGHDVETVTGGALHAAATYESDILPALFAMSEDDPEYARFTAKVLGLDQYQSYDRMALEANREMIGFMMAAVSLAQETVPDSFLSRGLNSKSDPSGDMPADEAILRVAMPRIADAVRKAKGSVFGLPTENNVALDFRRGIEAMMNVMYHMIVTSTEFSDLTTGNHLMSYLRFTADQAYGDTIEDVTDEDGSAARLVYTESARGLRRLRLTCGHLSGGLVKLLTKWHSDIVSGVSFKDGTRRRRVVSGYTMATDFTLSAENLANYRAEVESENSPNRIPADTKTLLDDISVVSEIISSLADVYSERGSAVEVTPAVMMGQLLPIYITMTERTMGAPSDGGSSVISLLGTDYYAKLAAAQADIESRAKTVMNAMYVTNFAPVSLSKLKSLARKGIARSVDPYETIKTGPDGSVNRDEAEARLSRAERAVQDIGADPVFSGVTHGLPSEVQTIRDTLTNGSASQRGGQNPDFRHTIDFSAGSYVLADAYHLTKRSGALRPGRSSGSDAADSLMSGGASEGSKQRAKVRRIADGMRMLLSGMRGANVVYRGGNQFTIEGTVTGEDYAKFSITVDMSDDILDVNNEEDVTRYAESRSYAASVIDVLGLREEGIVRSVTEYMSLPLDVRKSFVRAYSVGGVTNNKPVWSIDGRGIPVLLGSIRLSKSAADTKIFHEYFHAMVGMFRMMGVFSATDVLTLRNHFGDPEPGTRQLFNEERAAEAFRKFVEGKIDRKASSHHGVFRKMYAWLSSIWDVMLHGFSYRGAETADGTYVPTDELLFSAVIRGYAGRSRDYEADQIRSAGDIAEATNSRIREVNDVLTALADERTESNIGLDKAYVKFESGKKVGGWRLSRQRTEAEPAHPGPDFMDEGSEYAPPDERPDVTVDGLGNVKTIPGRSMATEHKQLVALVADRLAERDLDGAKAALVDLLRLRYEAAVEAISIDPHAESVIPVGVFTPMANPPARDETQSYSPLLTAQDGRITELRCAVGLSTRGMNKFANRYFDLGAALGEAFMSGLRQRGDWVETVEKFVADNEGLLPRGSVALAAHSTAARIAARNIMRQLGVNSPTDSQIANAAYLALMIVHGKSTKSVRASMFGGHANRYFFGRNGEKTKRRSRLASAYDTSGFVLASYGVTPAMMVESTLQRVAGIMSRLPADSSARVVALRHYGILSRTLAAVADDASAVDFVRTPDKVLDTAFRDMWLGVNGRTGFGYDGAPRPFELSLPVLGNEVSDEDRDYLAALQACYREPDVQAVISDTIQTMLTLRCAVNYYRQVGVAPVNDTDELAALRIAGRSEIKPVGEELADSLMSTEDLLSGKEVVDYFDQSYVISGNLSQWLASHVIPKAGTAELRKKVVEEGHRFEGVMAKINNAENLIAFKFGLNKEAGHRLLRVIRDRSQFRAENGDFVHSEDGFSDRMRFDNYHNVTCDVWLTDDEFDLIDWYVKMATSYASGDYAAVVGVNEIYFSPSFDRAHLFDSVEEIFNYMAEPTNDPNSDHKEASGICRAIFRMMYRLPPSVSGYRFTDDRLHVEKVDGSYGLVDRFVSRVRDVLKACDDAGIVKRDEVNERILRTLERDNLVKTTMSGQTGHREGALLVDVADFESFFTKRSSAHGKLVDAGRLPEELTLKAVADDIMPAWRELCELAKDNPWMTSGKAGQLNAFGTCLPFCAGSGLFGHAALHAMRHNQEVGRRTARLAKYETDLQNRPADDLLYSESGDDKMSPSQLRFFCGVYGIEETEEEVTEAIAEGEFEQGGKMAEKYGVTLSRAGLSAEISDRSYARCVYLAFNEHRDRVADECIGAVGGNRVLTDYISRYQEKHTGVGAAGITATQMYEMFGVLPANFQIGHQVHVAAMGIVNSMMYRNGVMSLLLTPSYDGTPMFYMNPSDEAAERMGVPDEVWGAVAQWWSDVHAVNGVGTYDPKLSGVENARRIYAAVRRMMEENRGFVTSGHMERHMYRPFIDPGMQAGGSAVTEVLCQEADPEGGSESDLSRLAKGEAYGYARHLFQSHQSLGIGGSLARASMRRVMQWSKTMSVGFSFFFPWATRVESPTGALGLVAALGSNAKWMSKVFRRNPEAANVLNRMFSGSAFITKNFLGSCDILEMMDSNDPFLADLRYWASCLGLTLSDGSSNNIMETNKNVVRQDIERVTKYVRRTCDAKFASQFEDVVTTLLLRSGDKVFTYMMNATKLAVAAQLASKLRVKAMREGRAFDVIRDMRQYANYINAEVGGIDPLNYAWAHPATQRILSRLMFSWQWSRSAWEAGGGTILEDLFLGGHHTTKEQRKLTLGRWLRMYLTVMIGIPTLVQLIAKAAGLLFGIDDDSDKWFIFQNEGKANMEAANITPFLRAMSTMEPVAGLKATDWKKAGAVGAGVGLVAGALRGEWFKGLTYGFAAGAVAPSLVPAWTGKEDGDTTGNRKTYIHEGKQGWEFTRYFTDLQNQLFSKQSMPLQHFEEGVLGRSLSFLDKEFPWSDMGTVERWVAPTTNGATFNMLMSMLPFTLSGLGAHGDAGFLNAVGPIGKGASSRAIQTSLVNRMTEVTQGTRGSFGGRVFGSSRSRLVNNAMFSDILADAKANGMDPGTEMLKAAQSVLPKLYGEFYRAMPKDAGDKVDTAALTRIRRAIGMIRYSGESALASIKSRLRKRGLDWDRNMSADQKAVIVAVLRASSDGLVDKGEVEAEFRRLTGKKYARTKKDAKSTRDYR